MKDLLQTYLRRSTAVGAAIGFFDNGNTDVFCHGRMSIQNGRSITEDSIFELGSITKVFTTLVFMDFLKKRMVQLDDPIDTFFPGQKVPTFLDQKITLEHLATHHSGLPVLPCNLNPKDARNPYANYQIRDLYEFLNNHKLRFPPGQKFEYSNLGIGLLGHILCLISKTSYEQLIDELILSPLSLTKTSSNLRPDLLNELCTGYSLREPMVPWKMAETFTASGGIRSNIRDMLKFLAANLIDSPISSLLKECHQLRRRINQYGSIGIGLGWTIRHSKGEIIWHDGITAGFRNFLGFNPKAQKGLVVLSNSLIDFNSPLFEMLNDQSCLKW